MSISHSVIARDDTFLGVCFAIGQDFGVNPTWLRLCFAGLLFWSALAAFGIYFGLGLLVAITRWIAPEPAVPVQEEEELAGEVEYELPLAA